MAPNTKKRKSLPADWWQVFDLVQPNQQPDLKTYLRSIVEACAVWLRASGASVFMRVGKTSKFQVMAQFGEQSTMPKNASFRSGEGIAGRATDTGTPLLISDPASHPHLRGLHTKKRGDISSSIVIPLLNSNGTCLGVLNISRGSTEAAFTDDDLGYAMVLGSQVALAIRNAQLLSETHRAVSERSALLARLTSVVESVGFGLLVVSETGRMESMNAAARSTFSVQTMPRRWDDWLELVPKSFKKAFQEVYKSGQRGLRKEIRVGIGNEAWKVVSSPFGQGGVTIAIQEVTEIEQAQKEVARVHRLAEIGQMTAAVAHEIRNPLTGILSAAQLGMSDPDSSQTCLDIVREEAHKLNGLCDDFLDFARPLKLNLIEMNLNQVVSRVLDRHRADIDAGKLSLTLNLEKPEPQIAADPDRIEQILHNLIRNAIQATPEGGSICVTTRPDGFSIEDTGCGMEETQMESLFTPFFTTKSQGTGLGLCNARKILDAHGASVSVRSSLGNGTRFDISWAIQKAA